MLEPITLLVCAALFGGIILYSFGFAPFVFSALPAEDAGRMLRAAFPQYYLFVLGGAALAAALMLSTAPWHAAALAAVALSTLYARQVLMGQINAARDAHLAGDAAAKRRFNLLHALSVALNMVQLVAVGWAVIAFA